MWNKIQGNIDSKKNIELLETCKTRYKVRLIKKKYAQKEDIDFNKIFSFIVKISFILMFSKIVVKHEL